MLQFTRISRALGLLVVCLMMAVPAYAQEQAAQMSYLRGQQALTSGDYATAEQLFRASLMQLRSAPSAQQGLSAYPLAGLARISLQRGRDSEALDLALQSERAAIQWAGPRGEARLLGMNIRGQVLSDWLDPQADSVWEEAVAIAQGLSHPQEQESIYTTYNNYADYLRRTGRADEAVLLHSHVIAQREAAAQTHPMGEMFLAISRLNHAVSLHDAGEPGRAEQEIKLLLLDLGQRQFNGSDVVYGHAASNLAQILSRQKRLDEARVLALDGLRQFTDPQDPARLMAANFLAIVQHMDGQEQIALSMFEEVYNQRLAMAWANHPSVPKLGVDDLRFAASPLPNDDLLVAAANLAYSYMLTGRTGEAVSLYNGLVAVMTELTGETSAVTASALADAGEATVRNGQVAEGVDMLERAHALIANDAALADFRMIIGYRLGTALLRAGEAERAVALIDPYSEALTGYSESIEVLSVDQLRFERFSRQAHEDLMDASWVASHGAR